MKKPLDNRNKRSVLPCTGLLGFMLASTLLLAGCGSPAGPPGLNPGMGPPGAPVNGSLANNPKPLPDSISKASSIVDPLANDDSKPKSAANPFLGVPSKVAEENNDAKANPMAPMNKVEQAGNTVSLASEIVFLKTNPFLDRLPKPVVEAIADPAGSPEVTVPADPFVNISLLGIAYNPKSPLALVAVAGGETQTQMVRTGDLLMMDGGQIKVISIASDGVVFQKVGAGAEKRTVALPNLVGYEASASKGGSTAANNLNPESGATVSKAAATSQMKAPTSNLPNLKKLTQGTPEINLKEP